MKKLFTLTILAGAAFAGAQSRSSFHDVDNMVDLFSALNGLNLTTNVGAAPTFMVGATTYHIKDVFAIYSLSDSADLVGSGVAAGVWAPNTNNAGSGGINGWKTNPNTGLQANQSVVLSYSSLAGPVDHFGYHVRLNAGEEAFGSNTLYVVGVPEPSTLIGLGMAAAALAGSRLRRKKA